MDNKWYHKKVKEEHEIKRQGHTVRWTTKTLKASTTWIRVLELMPYLEKNYVIKKINIKSKEDLKTKKLDGSSLIGNPMFLHYKYATGIRSCFDKAKWRHATLVGKIKGGDIFYWAHSSSRNGNDTSSGGLKAFFNDKKFSNQKAVIYQINEKK